MRAETAVLRVLGVDPGLAATGWAVVEPACGRPLLVASGTVRTSAGEAGAGRLLLLARRLREAIAAHRPVVAAVEQALVARNARSALALGQARGVALMVAAEAGLAVHEYLPMHVKQAVTGYGHAGKAQVGLMVARLVGAGGTACSSHAADAIAVALCHLGGGGMPREAARSRRCARTAWAAFVASRGR